MRLISTTQTSKTDPTGGLTLKALMDRRKALAEQTPEAPAQIASPWQGAAFMANSFVNQLQQNKADAQETAGRQALAQAMMKQDPTTGDLPPEAMATITSLDPETAMRIKEHVMAYRQQQAQQDASWKHEEAINTRELGEEKDREQRDLAAKGVWEVDPTDPTKFKNSVSGEVKYVEPRERWKPDPNDPNRMVSNSGKVEIVKPNDQWQPDPQDPNKLTNKSTGEVKYVKPNDQWQPDPADPNKLTNKATGEVKYVNQPDKWKPDAADPNKLTNITTGEVKYVKPNEMWVTDAADPNKMTNALTKEVKYVKPNDKWEDDPATPGAQINKATGERKYPPQGISIDKDGNIQIGGTGNKAPAENISKGLEFYTAAANAGKNLDSGMDNALRQAGPQAVEALTNPGVANYVATPEYRQAKTQGDAFINAVLRRESGAQISDQEYGRAYALYLPRPGDDDRTLEFKRINRKVKLQAIKNGVGADNPSLELIDEQVEKNAPTASTASSAAPAATDLPEGVTEDDITETMKANGLTRQQVLDRLKQQKQGGTNAGP